MLLDRGVGCDGAPAIGLSSCNADLAQTPRSRIARHTCSPLVSGQGQRHPRHPAKEGEIARGIRGCLGGQHLLLLLGRLAVGSWRRAPTLCPPEM